MRLDASDLKDLGILKHYRIIRRWACKNNNLTDADLELLIYFDCTDCSRPPTKDDLLLRIFLN